MAWVAGAFVVLLAVGCFYGGRAVHALLSRGLSVLERKQTLLEQRAKASVPPAIPPELLRRITRWADPTAQESERQVILSLYDEFRDHENPWQKVKSHLPPEPDESYSSPLLS